MVTQPTFRTDDNTRWGPGQGSDLAANVIDLNFWNLFRAVQTLEDDPAAGVGIDYISLVGGNQLFIHLTDHSVQGPFVVPTTLWTPRGDFLAGSHYFPLDVVSIGSALYIVNVQHTAVAPFNPNATDGISHFLYTLLLDAPNNALPGGGTIGQRLVRTSESPFGSTWTSDRLRLAPQIFGKPDAAELVMQFLVVDFMTIEADLAGSAAYARVSATAPAVFTLDKNGTTIGTITFAPSPEVVVSFPSSINFVPSDVISMTAPAIQDATLSDVSFTLVGLLTE